MAKYIVSLYFNAEATSSKLFTSEITSPQNHNSDEWCFSFESFKPRANHVTKIHWNTGDMGSMFETFANLAPTDGV